MTRRGMVVGIVLLTSIVAAHGGWEFVSVSTGTDSGGRTNENESLTVKGWVEEGLGRFEMSRGGKPAFEGGAYLLTRDAGKTVYLVNPKEKTYCTWDMDQMMGLAGGVMKLTGITFSEPRVEKLVEERGPKIAGFQTRHYWYRTTYTMQMGFMGFKRSTDVVTEQDIWATEDVSDAAFGAWRPMKSPAAGNPELEKLLKAEMSKVKGFPLKQVTVTKQTDPKGKTETTVATMEVISLKKSSLPRTLFEIPKDYKETALMPVAGAPQDEDAEDEAAPKSGQQEKETGREENPLFKLIKRLPRR